MFRHEMPRVYELQDLIDDPSSPCAYFQDFGSSIRDSILVGDRSKKRTWLAREAELQRLDAESWRFLKMEMAPYLTARHANGRGWEQLIAILNQARAHNHLTELGCSSVHFVPRKEGQATPDVEGMLNGKKVLCEVKTIQKSETEIAQRQSGCGGSTTASLDEGFLRKLTANLVSANKQMTSFDSGSEVKRIAFVVINFDDPNGEYKSRYFEQIDRHLADHGIPVDVVIYNQRTPFHSPVAMRHATVVNEPA